MQYNTANSTFVKTDKSIAEVMMLSDASGNIANPSSKTVRLSNTIAVNTSVYVANNLLGSLITLPSATRSGANSGYIHKVVVSCASNNQPALDVVFFSSNPANTTWTDHTNVVIANTDLNNIIGVVHVSDWTYLGGPNVGQATNLSLPFYLPAGNTLYAVMYVRNTPTFTATTDILFKTEVIQD